MRGFAYVVLRCTCGNEHDECDCGRTFLKTDGTFGPLYDEGCMIFFNSQDALAAKERYGGTDIMKVLGHEDRTGNFRPDEPWED